MKRVGKCHDLNDIRVWEKIIYRRGLDVVGNAVRNVHTSSNNISFHASENKGFA